MDTQLAQLNFAMNLETPLLRLPWLKNTYLKFEGGGIFYNHKFRSASYLLAHAIRSGRNIKKIADRSSGSWAMGLAWAAKQVGAASTFVSVNPPPTYVSRFVKALGGDFKIVNDNEERLRHLEILQANGFWIPDQHRNPRVIRAFDKTLGCQLARQLESQNIKPDILIGPIGTGGLIAGTGKHLRRRYSSLKTIGVDRSTSIVHSCGEHRSQSLTPVRGVGSEDEICITFVRARKYIDEIRAICPSRIHMESQNFASFFPASIGASTALALAAARENEGKLAANQVQIVLGPDRGETYESILSLDPGREE